MKSILKNQSGGALLSVLVAGVVAMGISAALVTSTISGKKRSSKLVNEDKARFAAEKVRALAGYLVTNNLILCRKDGWGDGAGGSKCRWGGNYHSPTLSLQTFDLKDKGVKDGRLLFSIDVDVEGTSVQAELGFDLVDWRAEPDVGKLLGKIPNENSIVDDDSWIVLMSVETSFFSPEQQMDRLFRIVGGLRRPQGMPQILITGNPNCSSSCVSAVDQNPFAECRGPHEVPSRSVSTVQLRVRNLGPGPLYGLKYEKKIKFASIVGLPDELSGVDIMGTAQVFMPDQVLLVPDQLVCMQPRRIVRNRTVTQTVNRSSGNTTGVGSVRWRRPLLSRTQVQTQVSRAVSVNSHQEPLASVEYSISVSPYDPKQVEDRDFFSTYDRMIANTFIPNPTHSSIEPRRYGGPQQSQVDFGVSRTVNTVTRTVTRRVTRTTIYYSPPH